MLASIYCFESVPVESKIGWYCRFSSSLFVVNVISFQHSDWQITIQFQNDEAEQLSLLIKFLFICNILKRRLAICKILVLVSRPMQEYS